MRAVKSRTPKLASHWLNSQVAETATVVLTGAKQPPEMESTMTTPSTPTHTSATHAAPRAPWWQSLGSLSVAALVLVATNGLYMLLVAFGNITDYATNYAFVERVLAMDTTNFGQGQDVNLDPDIMWRAIDSPVAANVGYIGLIIVEALAGIVLLIAVIAWIQYMRGTVTLAAARALATLGLVLVLFVFFTAFITVGGEWFSMWRSTDWNGLDPALQNAVLALLTLIVVHMVRDHRVHDQIVRDERIVE